MGYGNLLILFIGYMYLVNLRLIKYLIIRIIRTIKIKIRIMIQTTIKIKKIQDKKMVNNKTKKTYLGKHNNRKILRNKEKNKTNFSYNNKKKKKK